MLHPKSSSRKSSRAFVKQGVRDLVALNPSDRPWELPFAVALAAGLPMLFGAWFGDMGHAAIASIGAMTIIYLPRTRLDQRMVTVMTAGFGMIICYALGQLSHFVPFARVPIITLVAVMVTMACRYYRVAPPGSLFFVMATAIAAYGPGETLDIAANLGVFALGAMGAVFVAFFYSLHILRTRQPLSATSPSGDFLDTVVIDSLIIGAFVGLSLGAAQLLALEKPYWVPVSCLAVIQGINLRAVWNRQAQRIIGTIIGVGVTWVLLPYLSHPWAIAVAVTALTFCVETAIVRQYGFAAIFVTPLTILLAEASIHGSAGGSGLIAARFADTMIGSFLGLVGGFCLYHSGIRQLLKDWLSIGGPARPTS